MSGEQHPEQDPIHLGREGIGFLLSITGRAIGAQFDEALRPHGLDHARLVILRNVARDSADQPGGVSVKALSRKLIIPEPTLRDGAVLLGSAGYLTIRESGGDLLLLPKHKVETMLPVLIDATRWTHQQALNGFSREEIEEFSQNLRRVLKNFDVEPPRGK